MPRLLVVNPNTSQEVTDSFVAEARRHAPADVVIDGVTGAFGASIVSTRAENVVAAHCALDLIARHGDSFDAIILAISFDSGLRAARDLVACPVVGITEAAIEAASRHGKVGLIVFGAMSRGLYEDLVALYRAPVTAIEVIDLTNAAAYLAGAGRDEAVIAAAGRLAQQGVAAAVVCGAAIVGIAGRVAVRAPIALFDGAAPSVGAALRLAAAPATPFSPPKPLGVTTGVSEPLAAFIMGKANRVHKK